MSTKRIEEFFAAFKRLDASEMSKIYAANATFSDEVFRLHGRDEISRMWALLVSNILRKGRETWNLSYVVESDTSASWEATYLFGATGRVVTNRVRSQFVFDADGNVCQQVDTFNFWRWSRQALGLAGVFLGWSPLLKNNVRAKALENLVHFSKKTNS